MSIVPFPFGKTQVFTYGIAPNNLSVTLDADNFEFASSKGDNYLDFLGYDRYDDPEYLAKSALNMDGTGVWTGPAFVVPQLFEWRLQRLSQTKYETLWAMYRRQQKEKEVITLADYRLVMCEPTPKFRTAAGSVTGAPTIAGVEYFNGVFKIRLEMGDRYHIFKDSSGNRLYELSMQAWEILT